MFAKETEATWHKQLYHSFVGIIRNYMHKGTLFSIKSAFFYENILQE
jgi:hypothetical protein